jgi:hypothetical protein
MKTYDEMIYTTCVLMTEGAKDLQYKSWVACILLGEVYEVSQTQVAKDIKAELEHRENEAKKARKIE